MTSLRLRSLASKANGLPAPAFLPMLEALTTRRMSVAAIDPFRGNALLDPAVELLGPGLAASGIVEVVGE